MTPNPIPPINPYSVKAAGSWTNYLNRLDMRVKHNELGADDLIRLRDVEKEPWALIAKKFNVKSTNTVKGWYGHVKEEGKGTRTNSTKVG